MLHTTPPQSAPFFVVGAQRSGTTMLRLMLNAHSRLCVPFESRFIPDFHRRLAAFGDLSKLDNQRALLDAIAEDAFVRKGRLIPDKDAVLAHKPQDYAQLVHGIFAALAESEGKARWGDKTPSYVLDMDTLWTLFPGCRFIHLVRDGRDVAVSLKRDNWGPNTLHDAAYKWQKSARRARELAAKLGEGRWLTVSYEALVARPEEQVPQVTEFLGLSFEAGMLSPTSIDTSTSIGFSARGRTVQNFSPSFLEWSQAPKSVFFSSSVGNWQQLAREDVETLEALMGAELVANGYELTTTAEERSACSARLAITGVANLERSWQQRFDDQQKHTETLERSIADARVVLERVLAELAGLAGQHEDQVAQLARIRTGLQRELNRLERRQATTFESLERALVGQGIKPTNSRKYGDL